jgi:hypothetical protein
MEPAPESSTCAKPDLAIPRNCTIQAPGRALFGSIPTAFAASPCAGSAAASPSGPSGLRPPPGRGRVPRRRRWPLPAAGIGELPVCPLQCCAPERLQRPFGELPALARAEHVAQRAHCATQLFSVFHDGAELGASTPIARVFHLSRAAGGSCALGFLAYRWRQTRNEPIREKMARPHPIPAPSIRDSLGHVSGSEQRVAPKGTIISHGGVLPIHKHLEFFGLKG